MFAELSAEAGPLFRITENAWPKRSPIGGYVDDILCSDCETFISKFETYASTIIYDKVGKPHKLGVRHQDAVSADGVRSIKFSGLDYYLLKRFFLSILFRASCTKANSFKNVQLGPHEDIIRRFILGEVALEEDDYALLLFITDSKNELLKSIHSPLKTKLLGSVSYTFYINRLTFIVNISKFNRGGIFAKSNLRENGEMEILLLNDNQTSQILGPYFDGLLKKVKIKSK